MFNYTNKTKINFYLIIIIVIIWTILTELLFKGSQIFPSPSLIIISFIDLFTNYNFLINLISSISVIYISIFLTITIIRIKFPFFNYNSTIIKYLMQIPSFFLFVPGIMIAVLLIYWFGDNYLIKLFYTVFITLLFSYQIILNFDSSEIVNQINAVKSLGVSDSLIRRKIIWKFMEPEILKNLLEKHLYLWSTVIAFEFIQNSYGIGSVLRSALEFNDLSIIISLIILLSIIVFIGEKLLRFINEKYFFWK